MKSLTVGALLYNKAAAANTPPPGTGRQDLWVLQPIEENPNSGYKMQPLVMQDMKKQIG